MKTWEQYLAEIRGRESKAQLGPWTLVSSLPVYAIAGNYGTDVVTATGREYRQWHAGRHGSLHDDAEFIAHARADIPALIARIEELTKVVREIYELRLHPSEVSAVLARQSGRE